MSKFGIIMRDPQTEEFKVKLYKDNQGNLKGDGLCCYLKVGKWSNKFLVSLILTQEPRLESFVDANLSQEPSKTR